MVVLVMHSSCLPSFIVQSFVQRNKYLLCTTILLYDTGTVLNRIMFLYNKPMNIMQDFFAK